VSFSAIGDNYLEGGSQNQNRGSLTYLRVRSSGSNRALVQFDANSVSAAATGMTLVSAKVRLYIETNGDNWGSSGRPVDIHGLAVPWTEPGSTWNCAHDTNLANSSPDCSPTWGGGTFQVTPSDSIVHSNGQLGWVEWDVTSDVQAVIASPGTSYGWIVKLANEGQSGHVNYTSRDGATNHPTLVLTLQ
jgi:hypothetical protein